MSDKPPKFYDDIKNLYPDVFEHYEKLGAATKSAGPLDDKTMALVKLAMAIAIGHSGGTHSHTRKALRAGATPEEIRQVAILGTTTIGFPQMMRGMAWINDVLDKDNS